MSENLDEKINLRQLSLWNRQPTLWSHSCPAVKFVPRDDDELTFGTSPLSIEPLNMDKLSKSI